MAIITLGTDTSTKHDSTSVYNFSWTHTLVASAGIDRRVIFVSVGGETTDSANNPPWDVTGITYGGQAMTLLVKEVTTENGGGLSNNSSELWILKEANMPANGANTITVTGTTTNGAQVYLFGFCSEYDHVEQDVVASTHGTFFNGPVPSDTIGNTIDPFNADLVISSYVSGNAGSFTVAQGQNELLDVQNDTGPTNTFGVAELVGATPGPYIIETTYISGANRLTRCAATLHAYRNMNNVTNFMKINGVSRHDMGPKNGVL